MIRKFPNLNIYAQKAKWTEDEPDLPANYSEKWRKEPIKDDNHTDYEIKNPDFFAQVDPDVFLVGFQLQPTDAQAQDPPVDSEDDSDAGWFFVLEERAGDVRFGADIPKDSTDWSTNVPEGWADLTWAHVAESEGLSNLSELNFVDLNNSISSGISNDPKWSKNASNMAHIFFQPHFRAAIHGDQMIK